MIIKWRSEKQNKTRKSSEATDGSLVYINCERLIFSSGVLPGFPL
jgi:hypothetical protein